jgi:hypothetical protein
MNLRSGTRSNLAGDEEDLPTLIAAGELRSGRLQSSSF